MSPEWFAVIAAGISGVIAGLAWWESRKNHQDATEQQRRQGAAKLSVWWAHMRHENDRMTLVVDNQTPANVRHLSLELCGPGSKPGNAEKLFHELEYVPRGTWHMPYITPGKRKGSRSIALAYLEAVEDLQKFSPNQSPGDNWSVKQFSWLDGVDDLRWTRRRGESLELG